MVIRHSCHKAIWPSGRPCLPHPPIISRAAIGPTVFLQHLGGPHPDQSSGQRQFSNLFTVNLTLKLFATMHPVTFSCGWGDNDGCGHLVVVDEKY